MNSKVQDEFPVFLVVLFRTISIPEQISRVLAGGSFAFPVSLRLRGLVRPVLASFLTRRLGLPGRIQDILKKLEELVAIKVRVAKKSRSPTGS